MRNRLGVGAIVSADHTGHAIPSFRSRLREALASTSLPIALGRTLPKLNERRDAAFESHDFEQVQSDLRTRRRAAIDDLPELLQRFREAAEAVGTVVHTPTDAIGAVATVLDILHEHNVAMVVKSKSMATEEIGLNATLESDGVEVVETDLGEFLVQAAGERPSHIIAPALHITRERAARLIGQVTGEEFAPDPDALVGAARQYLRERFIQAGAGITGANALVAETGSVMLVSNEGNARLASSLPPVHIIIAGIDKLVRNLSDATVMMEALPRSATGQPISTYLSFISGPSRSADIELSLSLGVHGPRHVHVVLLDNGREEMRENNRLRAGLQCVRCGACSNICPVYQQVGGHAMGYIYTGPIGLLLTPFHHGLQNVVGPQSLCAGCGACASVCPAGIELPELILDVRELASGAKSAGAFLKNKALDALANEELFSRSLRLFAAVPGLQTIARHIPGSPFRRRSLPPIQSRPFRDRIRTLASPPGEGMIRVAYFPGCMTDWLSPEIGESTIRVLRARGISVEPIAFLSCCGLPAINAGRRAAALQMIRQTITAIEQADVDFVVSTSTSCVNAILNDYSRFASTPDPWVERAQQAASKIIDFASFISRYGLIGRSSKIAKETVTVHDACQSCHGLKTEGHARALLRETGYGVVEAPYTGECCGFGGSFSFDHPEVAKRMRNRKLEGFAETKASRVCVDNPGCLLHLRAGSSPKDAGRPLHLAELLADAID